MIGYYEFSEAIYDHFTAEENTNTIMFGESSEIDTKKQTIFPLAHAYIDGVNFPTDALLSFVLTITVLDIVNINKKGISTVPLVERWKGLDNRQDIYNTQLATLEKFTKAVRVGTLSDLDYEVLSISDAEKIVDARGNKLFGWEQVYTIQIQNTVTSCETAAVVYEDDVYEPDVYE